MIYTSISLIYETKEIVRPNRSAIMFFLLLPLQTYKNKNDETKAVPFANVRQNIENLSWHHRAMTPPTRNLIHESRCRYIWSVLTPHEKRDHRQGPTTHEHNCIPIMIIIITPRCKNKNRNQPRFTHNPTLNSKAQLFHRTRSRVSSVKKENTFVWQWVD